MNRLAPLLLLLATTLQTRAEKVATLPKPTGYIDDYANVISSSAKSELEGICNEVHDKTKSQVFFVTVKTTEGEEAQTFANELFAKWKIGEKKTDRGVLLLLAINDHKRWIEVGYGFEAILNDAKVGDIGRAMVPDLQASRYDAAARIGILDVSQIIAQDAGVTLAESAEPEPESAASESTTRQPLLKTGSPWIPVLLVPLFLGPFIGFFVLAWYTRRRRIASGIGSGSSSGGFSSSSDDSFSSSTSDSSSFDGGDGGSSGGGGAGGGW